ncbi:MAG: MerR family transcriptional regulator [Solirubrobacterales bacterium]|nr:MerR family transcriptional regulator [Solirubrobacterales bacterium]
MQQRVRTLKTSEAAQLLNVSPNTLRAWERRFGYPKPARTAGQHRMYTHGEVAALRDALQEGLSISSAISRAQESLRADTQMLTGALSAYELPRADAAMVAALSLRNVDRAVDEVLLPSLVELAAKHGEDSAPWSFAAQWAEDWLKRVQRMTPPATRRMGIVIGDATGGALDLQDLNVRILELFLARAGARVLTLPVSGVAGLGEALNAFRPDLVVLAGSVDSDEDVARWAYRARISAGSLPVTLFHRSTLRVPTTGAYPLSSSPSTAHHEILALIDGGARTEAPTMSPADVSAGPERVQKRNAS